MISKCQQIALVLVSFVIFFLTDCQSDDIPIKIIEEPSNYGAVDSNINNNAIGNVVNVDLLNIAKPKPPSGPAALLALNGKCFSKTDTQYKYEFCPFDNITQSEQSLRWNPYSGVLGVWRQWTVTNYSFSAQQYYDGDDCGSVRRNVNVYFRCGDTNALMSVNEPSTCQYEIIFNTPNICNTHNLLVYPLLSKSLQKRWNVLLTELHIGDITEKGYTAGLHTLLVEAGFVIGDQTDGSDSVSRNHFDNIQKCETSYEALADEVKNLKSQIDELKRNEDRNIYDNSYYGVDW